MICNGSVTSPQAIKIGRENEASDVKRSSVMVASFKQTEREPIANQFAIENLGGFSESRALSCCEDRKNLLFFTSSDTGIKASVLSICAISSKFLRFSSSVLVFLFLCLQKLHA